MIKKIFLFLALSVLWSAAGAFGLGGIKVNSALNEPLNARIALVSVLPEEIDNIKARLAGPDVFARAGISRPFFLSRLRFRLVAPKSGEPYIQVTTHDSVREPYLNFLMEVVWSRGNMVREFTVLLDPPSYTPPKMAREETPRAASPVVMSQREAPQVGERYGPVAGTDTLWVIAGKVQAAPSVSRNQTMIALLRANPDAFVNGNINQLKKGVVLMVPSLQEVNAVTRSEANLMVKQQMTEWRQARTAAKTVSPAPLQATVTEVAPAPVVPAATGSDTEESVAETPQADRPDSGEQEPEKAAGEVAQSKRLRVLDADGNWVVGEGDDKRYPAQESDRIREAIRDSEQELVAVQAINKDIVELRAALESKVEALKRALEEKDAQLESLRKQIEKADEKATAAVQGNPPLGTAAGTAGTPSPVPESAVPAGDVTTDTVLKEPKALSSYWKDEYWMLLMGAVIVILSILLLLSMRRRPQVQRLDTPELFQVSSEAVAAKPHPFPDNEAARASASSALDIERVPAPAPDVQQPFDTLQEGVQGERRQEGGISSILTEADIYLAYRRYSQAEALVQEAMQKNPQSPELKAKLLEIYAFRRDAKSFQRYLDQVYPVLMAQSPELWQKVEEMGRDLVPEHPAFNEGESGQRIDTDNDSPSARQDGENEELPDDLFDIDLDLTDDRQDDLAAGDEEMISIESLMDDGPMPDHHEIPSIEIDLDEDDLNLNFDEEQEPPRRKDDD